MATGVGWLWNIVVLINKIKMSSFKSSGTIQKKDGEPARSVSDYQSSSVTLKKLAMKARKLYSYFKLHQRSHKMTVINPNEDQMM